MNFIGIDTVFHWQYIRHKVREGVPMIFPDLTDPAVPYFHDYLLFRSALRLTHLVVEPYFDLSFVQKRNYVLSSFHYSPQGLETIYRYSYYILFCKFAEIV